MAGRTFPVIRMKGLTKFESPPPNFETKPEVIEHDVVGVKAFTIRPVYRNKLRGQVQNLPELNFTSAPFLLCLLTLSDVDHSAHKFNEIAGLAQNRMTYDVNVPYGAIRMQDAVVRLPLCLLADSRLDYFPEAGLVVGMKPLKEVFGSRETILRIETQNTVAFLRPVPDILLWTPGPTAGLAQPLRFRQVRFTRSEGRLGALLFAQVEDERDALPPTFKQRSSKQHGHAAAIFPEKLLLVWLHSPG